MPDLKFVSTITFLVNLFILIKMASFFVMSQFEHAVSSTYFVYHDTTLI